MKVGKRNESLKKQKLFSLLKRFPNSLARKLVFNKLHQLFGGRLRFLISGGAPLSQEVAEFFSVAGILILEGYGLTENCGAATINRQNNYNLGSVGLPIDGVRIKIAEDGEILLKGKNLMVGYYKNQEETDNVFQDGWFYTGDIGFVNPQGFLVITDRKKDLIITAGGKNIAPQNLEQILQQKEIISYAVIHGDRRKYLSALITLDRVELSRWADERHVAYVNYSELSQNDAVYEYIDSLISELNENLSSFETIKKFAILDHDFTQKTGELTPGLKIRRKIIYKKYKAILDSFYDENY